jgi:hypothetical protein
MRPRVARLPLGSFRSGCDLEENSHDLVDHLLEERAGGAFCG